MQIERYTHEMILAHPYPRDFSDKSRPAFTPWVFGKNKPVKLKEPSNSTLEELFMSLRPLFVHINTEKKEWILRYHM
jgi:hypothetical protein